MSALAVVPEQHGTGRWPTVSFSSLSKLTSCQRRWAFQYRDRAPEVPGPAMLKGTLLHQLWYAHWSGKDWHDELQVQGEIFIAEHPEATYLPDWIGDAAWLFDRYVTHYGDLATVTEANPDFEVVALEQEFKVKLPGKYGWLIGRLDGLWKIDGYLWLVEAKSMSDWETLDRYIYDPQCSLYVWAAREAGWPVEGVMVDAMRTYRWVAKNEGKHPVAESFDRRWVDRNQEHLDMAIEEAKAGLDMARALLRGAIRPLRNMDRHCGWCSYRSPCLAELCFNQPVIDILEDE